MSAARRQLTLAQLTDEFDNLRSSITQLQSEVSKMSAVLLTFSRCIKVLWGFVAPIVIAYIIQWIKSNS